MKPASISLKIKQLGILVMLLVSNAVLLAQDSSTSSSSTSVTVTKETTTDWLSNPWVWVIAGAVFILLLVALLGRGGSSSARTDRVTVSKTVQTDSDIA